MNERLKEIRKYLGLNQKDMGEKINVSQTHISSLENGSRELTDRLIADYNREFNVDENWLRTGEGKMFIENDSTIITELSNEYKLDAMDQKIIEYYLKMDERDRRKLKNHVVSLAKQITSLHETAATIENEIKKEVSNYEQEVRAEKKGEILSVLGAQDGIETS